MASRQDLHRRVDALSETQLEGARLIVVDEVAADTSVDAILARHDERPLNAAERDQHFGDLPQDDEG